MEVAASDEAYGKPMDGRGKQRLFPTPDHKFPTGPTTTTALIILIQELGGELGLMEDAAVMEYCAAAAQYPTTAWKILRSRTHSRFTTSPTGPAAKDQDKQTVSSTLLTFILHLTVKV